MKKIKKRLHEEVIEPANTEWNCLITFASKKDGLSRFCVDCRKLDAVSVWDVYPLSRLAQCIDFLGEGIFFSTLDANSGYWQIAIDERDRPKTVFTNDHGLFQFVRMPFGLKNEPMTFQQAIDIILSSVK